MKKIYLLGLASMCALAVNAQTTLKVKSPIKKALTQTEARKSANISGTQKNSGNNSVNAITGSLVCNTAYVADGNPMNLDFVLELTNTDLEFGDVLSITFPAGFTINSTTNTPNLGPDDGAASSGGPEAFVGITGQTITWGDDDNTYGGIVPSGAAGGPGTYPITINVTVAPGTTGTQVATFNVSGDTYGPAPADLVGGTCNILLAGSPAPNLAVTLTQPFNLTNFSECNYGLDTLVGQIKNLGNTTESNITVTYMVNGVAQPSTVVPGPLAPGDSSYVFWLPAYDFSATNTYDIKGYTALAGDINLANDTARFSFSNHVSIPVSTSAYFNGIESAQDVADVAVSGTAAAFTGLSNTTVRTGTQALFTTVNTTATAGTYNVFITLPCMDVVSGETYRISYWRKVNNNVATHRASGGIFSGLSNDGTTMTALKPYSTITPTAGGVANWSKDSVDFVATATETRYFAIAGEGTVNATTSFNFRVDDINIVKVPTVGIKENNTELVSIFPNPNAGVFTVKATENNSSVAVYSIIGENVYSAKLAKGNNAIDLSNVAAGSYIVKINNGGTLVTKRVVINK